MVQSLTQSGNLLQGFFLSVFNSLNSAVLKLVSSAVEGIPGLISAVILVGIGYIIGQIAKKIVSAVLEATMLDRWLEEQNLLLVLGGKKLSSIIGSFVKWYIVAIFLTQAVETFQLSTLKVFLTAIAYYIPLLLIGLIIFIAGLLVGRYIRNAIESTRYKFKKTIGLIVEVLAVYVSLVLALQNTGINVEILLSLFNIALMAFALSVAIIVGISFGFAFKDEAKKFIQEMKK